MTTGTLNTTRRNTENQNGSPAEVKLGYATAPIATIPKPPMPIMSVLRPPPISAKCWAVFDVNR